MTEEQHYVIKFRNDGMHYPFFQFTMALLNASLFGNALEPVISCNKIPAGYDMKLHNAIIEKFTAESYVKHDTTGLTLAELIFLMTAIDKISKLLLGDNAYVLKSIMDKQIPNLGDHWDKDFLKGAQLMFQSFEQLFKDLPEYDTLLQIVTGDFDAAEINIILQSAAK